MDENPLSRVRYWGEIPCMGTIGRLSRKSQTSLLQFLKDEWPGRSKSGWREVVTQRFRLEGASRGRSSKSHGQTDKHSLSHAGPCMHPAAARSWDFTLVLVRATGTIA